MIFMFIIVSVSEENDEETVLKWLLHLFIDYGT